VITQFKIGLISLLLTTTLFISACSSVKVDLYSDNAPELKLNEYFNGELTAHGIIKKPFWRTDSLLQRDHDGRLGQQRCWHLG